MEPAEDQEDLYQVIDTQTDGMEMNNTTVIQAMEAETAETIIPRKVNTSPEGQVLIDTIQTLMIITIMNRGENEVDENIDSPEVDLQEGHGVKRPLSPGETLKWPANYPRTITGEVMRTIEGLGRRPPQGGPHGGSRSFEMIEWMIYSGG